MRPPHRPLWLVLAVACTAQYPAELGPTFGGDQRATAALTSMASDELPTQPLTEAGLLAAWPVAVGRVRCDLGLCLDARAAWLPDDELLVAVGIEAVVERAPATVAFALDASGSMEGYEDVRAAAVQIGLDHLDQHDEAGLWAFTGAAVELVPAAPVDDALGEEVHIALAALDGLPVVRAATAEGTACDEGFDALRDLAPEREALAEWVELVELSTNPELGEQLLTLVCDDGSTIDEATAEVLASLPDGTVDRASRLVLVSDLGGPSAAEAVRQAAERFVGTSVLGVTEQTDTEQAAALATAPGAHTLEAPSPAHALAQWDARFDALLYPLAWDLDLQLSEASRAHWTLERHVGATDADGTGANALFASRHHGVLGVVLSAAGAPDATAVPPVLELTLQTPVGDVVAGVASRVPYRLIRTDWGEGDDEVALAVAWRMALVDAVSAGDADRLADLLAKRRPEVVPAP